MQWEIVLRAVGVFGIVAAYGVFRFSEGQMNSVALTMVITSIIGLVAPEALDALPFGPSKG